jgi:O-antigen/teichoic acid export membrane protein
LLTVLAALGLAIGIVFTFCAEWVIQSLFGGAYSASASVLKIHIWAGVFVFIGVAGSRWYLLENLQRLSFYRAAMGAILNVLLNLLLIPRYGVQGAASATVASQVMSSYLFDLQSKKSVPLFLMKTRALFMAPVDLCILVRDRLRER